MDKNSWMTFINICLLIWTLKRNYSKESLTQEEVDELVHKENRK